MILHFNFKPQGKLFEFISFNHEQKLLELKPFSSTVSGPIAILIHGYLGSAKDLQYLAHFLKCHLTRGAHQEHYSSILIYQYNTFPSIRDIAIQLDEDLQELKNRNFSLDIYAHSMGGLVSRWWIEQLGGSRYAQKLITFGTPHSGILANKYNKLVHLLQEKIPLAFSLKDMLSTASKDSDESNPFLRELNEPHSEFLDQVHYYTLAGNKWHDFQGFGGPLVHTLLDRDEEGMDGLVHISSAHSLHLGSKSLSWKKFPSQRIVLALNHLELLGVPLPGCQDPFILEQLQLPFSHIQEWATEWK